MTWQFILFGHNEHEIDKAKKFAKELDMNISFIINTAKDYSPIINKTVVEEKTGVKFLENSDKAFFSNIGWQNIFCLFLKNSPQINFNGDLLGCCLLSTQTFQVNVFKEGLLNALNHKNVIKAKLMLSDLSVEGDENVPCTNCSTYKILKEENRPVIWNG